MVTVSPSLMLKTRFLSFPLTVSRRYGATIRESGRREHVSAGRPTLEPWAESPSRYLAAPAVRPDAPRARIRSCRVARTLLTRRGGQ